MAADPKPRLLTFNELDGLAALFGDSSPFRAVLVSNKATDHVIAEAKKEGRTVRSHQYDGNIYMLGDDYADDYTKATINQKAVFVHECAHVWQEKQTKYKSSFAMHLRKADSIGAVIEKQTKAYELAFKDMTPSKRAVVAELAQRYLDGLAEKEMAHRSVNDFKTEYMSYSYDIDPVAVVYGPKPKWQTDAEDDAASKPARIPFTHGTNLQDHEIPKPGETFSEFLWRDPKIRARFQSRASMVDLWRDWEVLDYNYILQPMGKLGFYDLHIEAQAQMITDYFLIKHGVDPRTVRMTLSMSAAKRPPLEFYERVIPFACHSGTTHAPQPFKD